MKIVMSFLPYNTYLHILKKNKYKRPRSRKIYHTPDNFPIISNMNDYIVDFNHFNIYPTKIVKHKHKFKRYYHGRSIYDKNDTFKHILNDKSQPSTILSFMKNENI